MKIMSQFLVRMVVVSSLLLGGCSSCDDDFDDRASPDASIEADAADDAGQPDDGGTLDAAEPNDAGAPAEDAADSDANSDANSHVGESDSGPDADPTVCGDGRVEADEACDDGNTAGDDYCSADCSEVTGSCGDGVLQSAVETCDDGTTADCASTHDGGDGTCVPTGTCSPDHILADGDCIPETVTEHVHIYVANDCSMMVDPTEYSARPGQKVQFAWHNHSQFYPVDVWQSYIGGYTDLATGDTWNERHEWCSNVNAYQGYGDITTNSACPSHRFYINCPGR